VLVLDPLGARAGEGAPLEHVFVLALVAHELPLDGNQSFAHPRTDVSTLGTAGHGERKRGQLFGNARAHVAMQLVAKKKKRAGAHTSSMRRQWATLSRVLM